MKNSRIIISLLTLTLWAVAAWAQTPQEIISRMETEMNSHDKSEGFIMTLDIKIPILGTVSSKNYILEDKMRMEATVAGEKTISWTDATTNWTYSSKDNKIKIENAKANKDSQSDDNLSLFQGITEGYNVSIKKEDDAAWYLHCKKSKSNKDKDAPKNMDLVVSKANYYPLSLSASMKGIKMTIRDISFGVTEEDVTFNIKDFPGAEVEDLR